MEIIDSVSDKDEIDVVGGTDSDIDIMKFEQMEFGTPKVIDFWGTQRRPRNKQQFCMKCNTSRRFFSTSMIYEDMYNFPSVSYIFPIIFICLLIM